MIRTIFNYFNCVENLSGTNDKILEFNKALALNGSLTQYIVNLVFNDEKYGVSKTTLCKLIDYDKTQKYKDVGEVFEKNFEEPKILSDGLDFKSLEDFFINVKILSGKKLQEYIKTVLSKLSKLEAKWLVRILNKDLHFGLNLKSVNKSLAVYNLKTIEIFGVQLCGKISEIKEYKKFPMLAAVKYDGFRCVAQKKDGKITLISRQGKICNSFLPEIIDRLGHSLNSFTLDGEVISANFNDIASRIGRKESNINTKIDIKFVAFDLLKVDGKDIKHETQHSRTARLFVLQQENKGLFEIEESRVLYDTETLAEYYKEVNDRGEEGLVLKDLNAPYVEHSRNAWIKIKNFIENTFEIIDFANGSGKYCNDINKLQVKDSSGKVVSWAGSGFNDSLRAECNRLAAGNMLKGAFVDIKYQEIATNKNDDKKSLRFPTILKLRFDKLIADNLGNLD